MPVFNDQKDFDDLIDHSRTWDKNLISLSYINDRFLGR